VWISQFIVNGRAFRKARPVGVPKWRSKYRHECGKSGYGYQKHFICVNEAFQI
jgi:hypothetical protein